MFLFHPEYFKKPWIWVCFFAFPHFFRWGENYSHVLKVCVDFCFIPNIQEFRNSEMLVYSHNLNVKRKLTFPIFKGLCAFLLTPNIFRNSTLEKDLCFPMFFAVLFLSAFCSWWWLNLSKCLKWVYPFSVIG